MSRGDYLAASVRAADLPPNAQRFDYKGGGQMIDLFARFPSTWFRVGEVRQHVEACGVPISRDTVLDALNHLTEKMAFLEKVCYGQRGAIKLYRYRRLLTPMQRELAERGARKRAVARSVERIVLAG